MHPQEAAAALNQCSWTVVDHKPWNPQDRRPRYEWLVVDATKCIPATGATRVELHFLNDRLASVLLITADPRGYLAGLQAQGGWVRAEDGSLRREPATRVWSAVNYKGEAYAMWEDTCLADESRSWIEAYA
jgi:hypothetical protein